MLTKSGRISEGACGGGKSSDKQISTVLQVCTHTGSRSTGVVQVTGLNTELRVLYVMYVVQICTGGTFYL